MKRQNRAAARAACLMHRAHEDQKGELASCALTQRASEQVERPCGACGGHGGGDPCVCVCATRRGMVRKTLAGGAARKAQVERGKCTWEQSRVHRMPAASRVRSRQLASDCWPDTLHELYIVSSCCQWPMLFACTTDDRVRKWSLHRSESSPCAAAVSVGLCAVLEWTV